MSPLRTFATYTGGLGLVALVAFFAFQAIIPHPSDSESAPLSTEEQAASASSAEVVEESEAAPLEQSPVRSSGKNSDEPSASLVSRIKNPYSFPEQPFTIIHQQTAAALVNIFCVAEAGTIRPISGSGVIIDSRGVILTNAHVAQYILLADSGKTNLSCSIRWGSPARAAWSAEVLYVPPIWIQKHAADITKTHPTGTGEHDYALLRITGPAAPLASEVSALPSLPVDTREGIGFPGDNTLNASYPAEFVGAIGAVFGLHPISSTAPIEELFTFGKNTVDLISLGGVIGAQGGSSGGPVVNAWGRVIGVITTTSEGATTAERTLRALTLSYINRDIGIQSGMSLENILSGDIAARAKQFQMQYSASLTQSLIDELVTEI